jgi:endonuclease YncB( thermonuclease family)
VFGVDTPEKGFRAQCPSEAQRGEAASAFTKNAINQAAAGGGKIQVTMYGWDKFGGRVLGDILINGQSLRAGLIANGFAREYYGEAKQSWCN